MPADLTRPDEYAPTPFEIFTYDPNDLAAVSLGPDGSPLAGAAPDTHHFTPSSTVLDALGREVQAVRRNGTDADIRTRSTYDIRGNKVTVTDGLGRVALRYVYDLADRPLRTESIDAGLRRVVLDAAGHEVERRDGKGALTLQVYDALGRPVRMWARNQAGRPTTLRQHVEYGDTGRPDQSAADRAAAAAANLLGRLRRHYDEAGLVVVTAMDVKGNIVEKSRQMISDEAVLAAFAGAAADGWQVTPFQVDWQPDPQQALEGHAAQVLEPTAYQTTARYDALNRSPAPAAAPGRRGAPVAAAAGVQPGGPARTRPARRRRVRGADRLRREGRRALISYGNGIMTRYAYDPRTLRLTRLRSERYTQPDALTYRPGGARCRTSLTTTTSRATSSASANARPGSGVPTRPAPMRSTASSPTTPSTGSSRHRPGMRRPASWSAVPGRLPRGTDMSRARAYRESYAYDPAGNLLHAEPSQRVGRLHARRSPSSPAATGCGR